MRVAIARLGALCFAMVVKITWDEQAALHLEQLAGDPVIAELTQFLEALIKDVWTTNVERYEPDALGDTLRTLGHTSADNITQRVIRSLSPSSTLYKLGVRASAPDTSLLIEYAGYRFHVVKAPARSRRQPQWMRDFNWNSGSTVRTDSAAQNDRKYRGRSESDGHPPLFDLEPDPGAGNVQDCREVFLVWAGELGSGTLTSGWLGFPTTASERWLAVSDLWRDGSVPTVGGTKTADTPASPFDAVPVAEPRVTLKRNRHEVQGA